jgi:hydroxymethylpyrimidine pyrophosphatase-like HAD family hydrolase
VILPRVVATDLDGTLLRSDSTLSPRARAALRSARDAGLAIVLATARPARAVAEVFGAEDLADAAICANGAVEYDLVTGRMVVHRPLSPQLAAEVMVRIDEVLPGVAYAVETGHHVLHEPAYSYRPSLDSQRFPVASRAELVAQPLVKLLVLVPDGTAAAAWALLSPSLGDLVACTWSAGHGAADRAYPALLEISAPGVSKAVALADLCTQWSVEPDAVVAVGDAPNDLPMLAWAGRAYAVANAHPEVLAVAHEHLPTNDEDGVAVLLETLVTARRRRSPRSGGGGR